MIFVELDFFNYSDNLLHRFLKTFTTAINFFNVFQTFFLRNEAITNFAMSWFVLNHLLKSLFLQTLRVMYSELENFSKELKWYSAGV